MADGSGTKRASMTGPQSTAGPLLVDVTMFWSPSGGGVARYLRGKHEWLERRSNWRHTILAPGRDTSCSSTIPALPLPWSGGYRFPLQRSAIARRIVRLTPDLIEAGDPYRCAWSALDAGQQLGVPVCAFYHSNIDALAARWLKPGPHRLVRRYLRNLYSRYDIVFAASEWSANALYELQLDNVVHQPLGIDCTVFHPKRRDVGWRDEIGASNDTIVLLYAGRFAAEKNLRNLTEAVDRLGSPYMLIAIGDGPRPPSGKRVKALPYQSDPIQLARALASADLFVHAGDQETFGLAPLEALACGTPVVVRARGGLTDLIDGYAAIGVEHDGAAAFAEVISSVASRADALRDAARKHAQSFDADLAFTRLLARYRALCVGSGLKASEAQEEPYAA